MVSPAVFFVPAIEERYGSLSMVHVDKLGEKESTAERAARVVRLMEVIKAELEDRQEGFQQRFDSTEERLNRLADEILQMNPEAEISEWVSEFREGYFGLLHREMSPEAVVTLADRVSMMATALLGDELEPELASRYYAACREAGCEGGFAPFYHSIVSRMQPEYEVHLRQEFTVLAPDPEGNPVHKKLHDLKEALVSELNAWQPYLCDEVGVEFAAIVLEADALRHDFRL